MFLDDFCPFPFTLHSSLSTLHASRFLFLQPPISWIDTDYIIEKIGGILLTEKTEQSVKLEVKSKLFLSMNSPKMAFCGMHYQV